MKTLLYKLFGFSIGPIVGALITFVTVPITTAFIVPSEFGKASMFTVVQMLVTTVIFLGIDQSYTKEYHYVDDKKQLFQNALIVPMICTMGLSAFFILFRFDFSYWLFETRDYPEIAFFFSLMLLFSAIERFVLLAIRMEEKALEYSFYTILVRFIILLLTIMFLFTRPRDFLTVVYANLFGQMLGGLIILIKYRKLLSYDKKNYNRDLIKKMVIFGYPIVIAASLTNLLNTLGRIFLRGNSAFHDLGVYAAALKIAGILTIVQLTFTSFFVPLAYRWDKENKEMKYFNFMSKVTLLFMTFLFFFIVYFKELLVFILSKEYADAKKIASLLALTPILYTLSETTTLGIVFSGKSYYNLWVSLLAIIPTLILNYFLVPIYGTIGASVSTATAYVVFCFARTYFSRKSGFLIDFKHQFFVILLLYLVAVLNAFESPYEIWLNSGFFILSLVLHYDTVKLIIEVIRKPEEWDFE